MKTTRRGAGGARGRGAALFAAAGLLLLAACRSQVNPEGAGPARDDPEDLIISCMAERGFAYHPQPEWVSAGPVESALAELDYDHHRFAEEWGFGVATLAMAKVSTGIGPPTAQDELINSLSAVELDQYYEALFGEETDAGPQGCYGEAYADEIAGQVQLAENFRQTQDAAARVDADPRTREFYRQWSGCMAEQGISAETPADLVQQLETALEQARQHADDDIYDPVMLRDAQRLELRAAQRSVECGFVPLLGNPVLDQIAAEYNTTQ